MKRAICCLLILAAVLSCSAALAQRIPCYEGGFSLTLPDHFIQESYDPSLDPELCFYWHGNKLTVQAYASPMGEIAFSDLFQVLTGNETESGRVRINGMDMLYARTDDASGICVMYSWMDRGNNVTLYFYYSDPSVIDTVNEIISSIAFDAGH